MQDGTDRHDSFGGQVLLATSLVGLAIATPLNTLIIANPEEPVCWSCMAIVYGVPLALLTDVLTAGG